MIQAAKKKRKVLAGQVKKEDKEIPHSYKMLIVLRIETALHKKSKPSSRITSSQPSM